MSEILYPIIFVIALLGITALNRMKSVKMQVDFSEQQNHDEVARQILKSLEKQNKKTDNKGRLS